MVRLGLSLRGPSTRDVLRAAREIIRERFVCRHNTTPSPEANSHRRSVYRRFLPGKDAKQVFRRELIERLWNGDIRNFEEVEHIEVGCCKSEVETLALMTGPGLRALMQTIQPLNRGNWLGAGKPIKDAGLPAQVHAQTKEEQTSEAPGAPRAIAAASGGGDRDKP